MWGFNLDGSFPSLFLLLLLPIRINNDPAVTSGIPLPLAFHHANSLTPSYAPKTHGFRLDFLLSHTSHHPTKLLRNCYVVYRTRAPCKTSATFFVCAAGAGYGFSYVVFCCSSCFCCCLLTFFQHKKRSLYTTTIIWIPSYSVFFSAAHR